VRSITPPEGATHASTRSYDAADRLTEETQAESTSAAATTRYAYSPAGTMVSSTDPVGRITTQRYDVRGLLIEE
jgi:YD repeat-containing protein